MHYELMRTLNHCDWKNTKDEDTNIPAQTTAIA